jgi:hypothetical protein
MGTENPAEDRETGKLGSSAFGKSGPVCRRWRLFKGFFCKQYLLSDLRSSAKICVLMGIEKVLYA